MTNHNNPISYDELARLNERLIASNQALRADNDRLRIQNGQLADNNLSLLNEHARLIQDNGKLMSVIEAYNIILMTQHLSHARNSKLAGYVDTTQPTTS